VTDNGVPPAITDASGSQGLQVGTGNVQNNTWLLKPTPDFAGLSLHAGVARIRQLPHDDAVDLFATASPEDLTVKLRVLLQADERGAVSILADLNQRRAAELISPIESEFPWLADLSLAAEAIAQHAVNLKWDPEAGKASLERAEQSSGSTGGYFRQYHQGRIYWSGSEGDICAIRGLIAEFHMAAGGTGGELGFPLAEEEHERSVLGTEGATQAFEGGYIVSSRHGRYAVEAEVANIDIKRLGFPVSAAETRDGVTVQRLEAGIVYSTDAGIFAVRAEVAECADDWLPVSDEERVDPFTDGERVQRFKNAAGVAMAVYSSSDTGVHRVVGRKFVYYEALGGPVSELGFPTSTATALRDGWIQKFEHGTIYDRLGHQPVTVAAGTVQLVKDRLGWPVSEEKFVGDGVGDSVQYFENGVVTMRDGKREIWLRP